MSGNEVSGRTVAGTVIVVVVILVVIVAVTRHGTPEAADGQPVPSAVPHSPAAIRRALPSLAAEGTVSEPAPAPAPAPQISASPTHAAGPKCESCSAQNCVAKTDGCDRITDPADRKLCEDLYACFSDPANDCVNQGDPVRCWCGTNPTTCLTDKTGPTRANGPCAAIVHAAAKTEDPSTIRARFVDPDFPLGSAVNLTLCRGSWCSNECKVQ